MDLDQNLPMAASGAAPCSLSHFDRKLSTLQQDFNSTVKADAASEAAG